MHTYVLTLFFISENAIWKEKEKNIHISFMQALRSTNSAKSFSGDGVTWSPSQKSKLGKPQIVRHSIARANNRSHTHRRSIKRNFKQGETCKLHENLCTPCKCVSEVPQQYTWSHLFSRLKQQLCDLKNSENGVKVLNIFSQTSKCPQKKSFGLQKKNELKKHVSMLK